MDEQSVYKAKKILRKRYIDKFDGMPPFVGETATINYSVFCEDEFAKCFLLLLAFLSPKLKRCYCACGRANCYRCNRDFHWDEAEKAAKEYAAGAFIA